MRQYAKKCLRKCGTWALLTLVLAAYAAPVGAQKKNDKKKEQQANADAQADLKAMMNVPDSQAVERAIGEALGYWQIGDVESLHKYYSNDVVVVSGAWEPPVIGWDNFLKSYQAQRATVAGGRIDRSNTLIKVNGNYAWGTYQFVYTSMNDGKVVQFHGHTTVILNKQGDQWVIVLNHSSVVDGQPSNQAVPATSTSPGRS